MYCIICENKNVAEHNYTGVSHYFTLNDLNIKSYTYIASYLRRIAEFAIKKNSELTV